MNKFKLIIIVASALALNLISANTVFAGWKYTGNIYVGTTSFGGAL